MVFATRFGSRGNYKLDFSRKTSGFNISENQLLENCLGYHFVPTLIFKAAMGWTRFECWAVFTPRLVLKPIIKLVLSLKIDGFSLSENQF